MIFKNLKSYIYFIVVLFFAINIYASKSDNIIIKATVTQYKKHDLHTQIENEPYEWHDLVIFKINEPKNLNNEELEIFLSSDKPEFKLVVGEKYSFKIKKELFDKKSKMQLFSGAIQELKPTECK
ncbi:hypothetical protein JXR93_08320 [bacterium]|nr:hypothetical protein [bacterium]